jgi:glycosyltransferase involved in cell wall biosynthesis
MRVLILNDGKTGGGAETVFSETSHLMKGMKEELIVKASTPYDGMLSTVVNGFGLVNFPYTLVVAWHAVRFRPHIIHIHNYIYRISPLPILMLKLLKKVLDFSVIYTAHDFHLVCPNSGLFRHVGEGKFEACTLCVQSTTWHNVVSNNCDRRGLLFSLIRYTRHKVCYDWLSLHETFDLVICPSEFLRAALKQKFPNLKTQLLRNPSFVQNEMARSQATYPLPSSKVIAYFGRLTPEKGVLQYIEEKYDSLEYQEFLIYGEGEQRDAILAMIEKKDLSKHVYLMGRIPQAEVGKAMGQINAIVLPSLCLENCPLVVCDALKLGKEVVSREIGGAGELMALAQDAELEFLEVPVYLADLMGIYKSVCG